MACNPVWVPDSMAASNSPAVVFSRPISMSRPETFHGSRASLYWAWFGGSVKKYLDGRCRIIRGIK